MIMEIKEGKKYHYDDEFKGERLADTFIALENSSRKSRKVLVYSPKLRANILIYKSRLRKVI